jgi:AcrR family transcriptional regulator
MSESSSAHGEVPPVKKGDHYHHPDLREAMIRVAQDLLESEGPSGWTVRAAARIAGVSSGAPYRHFADKDTLLAAVAARGFEELLSEIQTQTEKADGPPGQRLDAAAEAYVSFALAKPGRYQVMFGREIANRKLHPGLSDAADRTFEAISNEVQRAQNGGVLRKDRSAQQLAAGAWAMLHGLCDLILNGRIGEEGEGDPIALVRSLGRAVFEGVAARS